MDQKTALQRIAQGRTCLWVGSGVTTQLARANKANPKRQSLGQKLKNILSMSANAGKASPLGWGDLVTVFEKRAGIIPGSDLDGMDYPARLDVVFRMMGRDRFQRELRRGILEPTARSIIEAWRDMRRTPPDEIDALAHLGFLANPIVNFNIETLSSQALVLGSGPWDPIVFHPPVPDALKSPRYTQDSSSKDRHHRRIYHPHGAINISGICVMAEHEYQSMNGTLALQIATHAAFGLDLAIVGMSLQDAYLRRQIEQFREQIEAILWFTGECPQGEINEWCIRTEVEVIKISRPEFWHAVSIELPGPDSLHMAHDWLQYLVVQAKFELGNPMMAHTNGAYFNLMKERPPEEVNTLLGNWHRKASLHGEDAKLNPQAPFANLARDPDIPKLLSDIAEIGRLMRQSGDVSPVSC